MFFTADGCAGCFSLLMVVLGVFHCWWLCWVFFTADGCAGCFSLLVVVLGVSGRGGGGAEGQDSIMDRIWMATSR